MKEGKWRKLPLEIKRVVFEIVVESTNHPRVEYFLVCHEWFRELAAIWFRNVDGSIMANKWQQGVVSIERLNKYYSVQSRNLHISALPSQLSQYTASIAAIEHGMTFANVRIITYAALIHDHHVLGQIWAPRVEEINVKLVSYRPKVAPQPFLSSINKLLGQCRVLPSIFMELDPFASHLLTVDQPHALFTKALKAIEIRALGRLSDSHLQRLTQFPGLERVSLLSNFGASTGRGYYEHEFMDLEMTLPVMGKCANLKQLKVRLLRIRDPTQFAGFLANLHRLEVLSLTLEPTTMVKLVNNLVQLPMLRYLDISASGLIPYDPQLLKNLGRLATPSVTRLTIRGVVFSPGGGEIRELARFGNVRALTLEANRHTTHENLFKEIGLAMPKLTYFAPLFGPGATDRIFGHTLRFRSFSTQQVLFPYLEQMPEIKECIGFVDTDQLCFLQAFGWNFPRLVDGTTRLVCNHCVHSQ